MQKAYKNPGKPYLPPKSFLCGPHFSAKKRSSLEQGGVCFLFPNSTILGTIPNHTWTKLALSQIGTVHVYLGWPFFTQISGRKFLPEICGEVHPENAPLQAVCCALYSTEQSTFEGEKRKSKKEKDLWKQVSGQSPHELFWGVVWGQKRGDDNKI